MMAIGSLVPRWLARVDDMDDDIPTGNLVPKIATIPLPDPMQKPPFDIGGPAGQKPSQYEDKPSQYEDQDKMIFGRAAVMLEQIKRERETAQVELAEAVLARQADMNKIDFLEKENAQLRLDIAQKLNDIQTLQSQIAEYRRFMDVWKDMNDKTRQVFDRFGVKGSPKKERKPRPRKERKAPDQHTGIGA